MVFETWKGQACGEFPIFMTFNLRETVAMIQHKAVKTLTENHLCNWMNRTEPEDSCWKVREEF